MKKVSLSTIAKQLNVSAVTVHKALKNQQGVSDKLRLKIIETAERLGYKPPSAIKQNADFIFLIHKNFILSPNEQFYSEIYHHLNLECMLVNAKLHLIVHEGLKSTAAHFKTAMSDTIIDGIFISGQIDSETLEYIGGMKMPTVCVDFYSSDYSFDYIYADNYYAGYILTKYLIKKGHKEIGFIGNINFSNAIADRYFGYLRALNKYGIAASAQLHINHNIETDGYAVSFAKRPTAYICHCDRAAAFLYDQIKEKGLSIPDDISVIGFDNTDICEHLQPKLTSFGIERSRYASQALKTMLARTSKQKAVNNYIKLKLDLIEKKSLKTLSPQA
jgi:LacI family transcriptional regulator